MVGVWLCSYVRSVMHVYYVVTVESTARTKPLLGLFWWFWASLGWRGLA